MIDSSPEKRGMIIQKHGLGEIPEEHVISVLAEKIVALQTKMSEKGKVAPRTREFMENLLRKGLVFYAIDANDGRAISSFYMQPIGTHDNAYRFGGMASDGNQAFPANVANELEKFRNVHVVLYTSKRLSKFFSEKPGFTVLQEDEFRTKYPTLFHDYQASSETHQVGDDQVYCVRKAASTQ